MRIFLLHKGAVSQWSRVRDSGSQHQASGLGLPWQESHSFSDAQGSERFTYALTKYADQYPTAVVRVPGLTRSSWVTPLETKLSTCVPSVFRSKTVIKRR
ncbi:hypothetical protein AVEN_81053-1, partial [Araneus ventricosus]